MGYVSKDQSAEGTEIFIKIREKLIKAAVVKIPFIKK